MRIACRSDSRPVVSRPGSFLPRPRRALIIASVMLNSRVQAHEEEKLRAVQRRLEEAESHGSEAGPACRRKRKKRRAQSKEKLAAFYSKTAHSLRIPISVIQGYADLLGSGLIHDENVKREYLSKIRERTEYLNTVLGQLLVEARVQADFSISVWERFDLIELLRRLRRICGRLRRSWGLTSSSFRTFGGCRLRAIARG